jgi:hypothetical protein
MLPRLVVALDERFNGTSRYKGPTAYFAAHQFSAIKQVLNRSRRNIQERRRLLDGKQQWLLRLPFEFQCG